ncbi:hypothetical protein [Cellulomonas aerilata]|uniref:TrbL/VirB6 plasmid conjugal transfer protein n=1 Tax=Cellulomonas aerilata TaxID=515326 RepID=A0A512D9Z1_9CELL|nr:hypothetical protein [Cellulomonas aerilata]GEO33304.1 hypothetical protein CAE01nite_10290 [Cellulomonas aerilata]
MSTAGRGSPVRRLAALVVAVGFVLVGPAFAASAASSASPVVSSTTSAAVVPSATTSATSAAPAPAATVVTAIKACAPPPAPNRPTAGLPGKLAPGHAETSPGDPFTDPDVALSDVYGYSYRWVNYDNGCVPGSAWGPGFVTGVGNLLLAGAASTNALVHSTLGFVVDPTWLAPLDRTITEATQTVRDGVWTPWITIALVLVAGTVLVAAARAEFSNAVTSAGWALLVLVAATYVMSYPISSARAVDGLIQETVTASARATSTTDDADGASGALTQQMDSINRNSLYSAWLEGTLGSSDSAVAREHGPDLFRASHMTWWEAQTLDEDPEAGQAIVEEKKNLWAATAAEVESADPLAYQQLTGNQGRWDAAATVTLMTAITMPFLLVAGVFVVVAYTVTRLFIPLAPALGVFGMLELARGWVIGVVGQFGRFLIMGPLYWIAALVNLALISSVFRSDLPFGLQAVLALALPLILFKLLRPKSTVPGAGFLRRMGRLAVSTTATKRAVTAGVDDAVVGDAPPVARNDGPVAHSPRAGGEVATERPALPAGPAYSGAGTAVSTRGTFAGRPEVDLDTGAGPPRRPRQDVAFVTSGGVAARRAGPAAVVGDGDPEGRTIVVEGGVVAARPHPAHPADEAERLRHQGGGTRAAERAPVGGADVPDDADLAAPATPRVLRPDERVPVGVTEANVRDVDGEEVFVLWRPQGGRTAARVDALGDDR